MPSLDGYIRVSRRAGREGDSFISPDVQRNRIIGWMELNGVALGELWEEIDQSGARLERPLFQEALARCEAGETGGIVVARLDRFARSAVDALTSIRRLNDAGARLVSVEDNFDGSTPMGRFAIGILTLMAELELERIRENWATAVGEAVGRGVHVSRYPPTGYRRGEGGRLVRDERAAVVVAEAFRRRALGASWADLARFFEASELFPPTGNRNWSKVGVSNLLKNPAYLGQARSGTVVNDEAHEPIVTRAEFDAAQATRTLLRPRDGSLASQAMLGGLVRCSGCGHTLKITGNTDRRTGARYPIYYCTGRYASGLCASRATARASAVDDYVEERVLEALVEEGGVFAQAVVAAEGAEQAARALTEAEHELDLFVGNPRLLTMLGETRFLVGVTARQRALDEVRETLAMAASRAALAEGIVAGGDLLEAWPTLGVQEKRQLMHGFLDRVVLTRAVGRGRHANPIPERTQIVMRGNVLLGSNPDESTGLPT